MKMYDKTLLVRLRAAAEVVNMPFTQGAVMREAADALQELEIDRDQYTYAVHSARIEQDAARIHLAERIKAEDERDAMRLQLSDAKALQDAELLDQINSLCAENARLHDERELDLDVKRLRAQIADLKEVLGHFLSEGSPEGDARAKDHACAVLAKVSP